MEAAHLIEQAERLRAFGEQLSSEWLRSVFLSVSADYRAEAEDHHEIAAAYAAAA